LPREIHRLEPEESCCQECGSELDYLGEVSAEQLELVSSALKVIRTVRVKKACTKCDCIVEAPAQFFYLSPKMFYFPFLLFDLFFGAGQRRAQE
ncbi:hypothetical protein Q604_UNBC11875G0001, partial [human gut metagenome]